MTTLVNNTINLYFNFLQTVARAIIGQNRRLPEWPIAKTADNSLGPPEINLHIPLIQ